MGDDDEVESVKDRRHWVIRHIEVIVLIVLLGLLAGIGEFLRRR